MTNPGSQTTAVGQSVSLQIHATDSASGPTLTYAASGLPAGLAINSSSGLISGTPTTPGSFTVTATATDNTGAGGSTTFTWTINGTGGATLTYAASGLPAGLAINSSSGLISGTPTTPGSFTVTATATDNTGATGSTTFTWTIHGTGGGSCTGQKLANPGFESGPTAWTGSTAAIGQWNDSGEPAHTGTWNAWLDGYGYSATDNLSQSVAIPAGCHATLSFYLHVDTDETSTSVAYDKLTVKVGSATVATYSNLNAAPGYTLHSVDVSSYAGKSVSLSFTGTEDASLQTSFVLDDTALTLSGT